MTQTKRRFSNCSDAAGVVVVRGNTMLLVTLGLEIWVVGMCRSILLAIETLDRECVSSDNEYAIASEW
jgi:hypothetical protein